MHYKTIKFNIKIPLNIFKKIKKKLWSVLCAKFDIATLRALTFAPPIRKMDQRRCLPLIWVRHFSMHKVVVAFDYDKLISVWRHDDDGE